MSEVSEREDGEITDEFENIISSDEEFSMRQRIEELEARNRELEKISNISVQYECDLDYRNESSHSGIPIINLCDSGDYQERFYGKPFEIKKSDEGLQKSSANKSKFHTDHLGENINVQKKLIPLPLDLNIPEKKNTKYKKCKHSKFSRYRSNRKTKIYKINKLKFLYMTSSEENENDDLISNRLKLKLALKRDDFTTRKGNLKNCMLKKNKGHSHQTINLDKEKSDNYSLDDCSIITSENELRLLALKSAFEKKHLARKSRQKNGKKPYSPTDFLEPIVDPFSSSQTFSDIETRLIISPLASPKYNENYRPLSPVYIESAGSNNFIICNNTTVNGKNLNILGQNIDYNMKIDKDVTKHKNLEPNDEVKNHEPIDEEEIALRALLLSKLNSPKSCERQKIKVIKKSTQGIGKDFSIHANEPDQNLIANVESIANNDLRNSELLNMKSKINRTEKVLKEAVRRLKSKNELEFDYKENISQIHEQDDVIKKNHDNSRTANIKDNSNRIVPENSLKINDRHLINYDLKKANENSYIEKTYIHQHVPFNSSLVSIPKPTNTTNFQCQVHKKHAVKQNFKTQVIFSDCKTTLNNKENVIEKLTDTKMNPTKQPSITTAICTDYMTTTEDALEVGKSEERKSIVNKSAQSLEKSTKSKFVDATNYTFKTLSPTCVPKETVSSNTSSSIPLVSNLIIPTVKKMVIRINQSDSDSDVDVNEAQKQSSQLKNVENNIQDNSSLRKLYIGRQLYSPVADIPDKIFKINKSSVEIQKNLTENSILNNSDYIFQAKLDEFLKKARTKVKVLGKEDHMSTKFNRISNTSLAVRHLSQSSQMEYRKLINRMKILERQKENKKYQNFKTSNQTIHSFCGVTQNLAEIDKIENFVNDFNQNKFSKSENDKKKIESVVSSDSIPSLKHTISDKSVGSQICLKQGSANEIFKNEQLLKTQRADLKLLDMFETTYQNNSTTLLQNISKSLSLVNLAKKEKLKKIKLEHELKELKRLVAEKELELAQQSNRISKIYPILSKSYDFVVRLKNKCTKLDQTAVKFGKRLKGDTYESKSKVEKIAISMKSRLLSSEIKKLKNIRHNDIILDSGNERNVEQAILAKNNSVDSNGNLIESAVSTETEQTNKSNLIDHLDRSRKIEMQSVHNDTEQEININEALKTQIDVDAKKETSPSSSMDDYISPLNNKSEKIKINPNGVICPYQLMGQCEDKECRFEHLPKI